MKFMKLGSKPDTFQSDGTSIRYVSSELATDVTITVGEVKFYLHKFPLLSKSSRLQKLILEDNSDEIELVGFPGGPKAFDICAKFCYGMTVTLNPYNVVAARCASEYLGMTEDTDRGNLTYKIEVFLNSTIFRTWKDSIIVLQTTKSLLPWSDDLNIVGRSIDSIASKTSIDPTKVTWSYTFNRKSDSIVKHEAVVKDWWVEDICELDTDMFKRVVAAIKSKGRMDGAIIGEALRTYAVRWLPDSVDSLVSNQRNKSIVETLVSLLPPSDKSPGYSCSFLLKLLKVVVLVEIKDSLREELVRKISMKLDEATVKDLLILARPPQITIYDIELVKTIVEGFVMHGRSGWEIDSYERNDISLVFGHGSWVSVSGLVDGYLAEIGSDKKLPVSSFVEVSRLIPESARPVHDGLYYAIDIYLKEHPDLSKAEKKQICGVMDVKKLTVDASMHAAQNERLPLRLVVQVLYFEQMRTTSNTSSSTRIKEEDDEEEWDKRTVENCTSLRDKMKAEEIGNNGEAKTNSRNGAELVASRSRRIFDKLMGMGKGNGESPETSVSSQSPTTSLAHGDTKSSSPSSRNRRFSVS